MSQFDAIRPYEDEDIPAVLGRLNTDKDFLGMVGKMRSPLLYRILPGTVRRRVAHWLEDEFEGITTIREIQRRVYGYVETLVEKTTSRLTVSGLDSLDPDKAYLFLSNHRDIVFDPMVVNFLLARQGLPTTRIAIGDNLLQNRGFAELMRLNKSFVVRRGQASPREMRDTYMTLSQFIHNSVVNQQESIWLAQREGRAKDGLDVTEPAILKMLYMSHKRSGESFSEALQKLNIVPVSVAYEYDPCDVDKAKQLASRQENPQAQRSRSAAEDTAHIMKGLSGFKGHVHVHFGKRLTDIPKDAKALAQQIDCDIQGNYRLHGTNLAAYRLSLIHPQRRQTPEAVSDAIAMSETLSEAELEAADQAMSRRLEAVSEELQPYLLAMYANPVVSALGVQEQERSSSLA